MRHRFPSPGIRCRVCSGSFPPAFLPLPPQSPVRRDNDNLLIFNAMENGARRVFLADMRKFQ